MPIVSCSETSHWPLKRAQGDRGAKRSMVRIWNYDRAEIKLVLEVNGFDTVKLAILELKEEI